MLGSLALLACGPLYFACVAAKKRVADLQQLFTLSGLKGLCAPGPEGEPVRIPIEQNIWRWVWLGAAILVFAIAIVLAKNVR